MKITGLPLTNFKINSLKIKEGKGNQKKSGNQKRNEEKRNKIESPRIIFVHDKRLNRIKIPKRSGRNFLGGIRYGAFYYSGSCPDPSGTLDGISVAKADNSGGKCFTDSSKDPITDQIGFICFPSTNPGDPATIFFGNPQSESGIVIGGPNFAGFIKDSELSGWKWGIVGIPTYKGSSAETSCTTKCDSTYCSGTCTTSCSSPEVTSSGESCVENVETGTYYFVPTEYSPLNCGDVGACCSSFNFPQTNYISTADSTNCNNPENVYTSSACAANLQYDSSTQVCYSGTSGRTLGSYPIGQVIPSIKMSSFSIVVWAYSNFPLFSFDWAITTSCGSSSTPKCGNTNDIPICKFLSYNSQYKVNGYVCTFTNAVCDTTTGGPYYINLSNGNALNAPSLIDVETNEEIGSTVFWDVISTFDEQACGCVIDPITSTTYNFESFSLKIN